MHYLRHILAFGVAVGICGVAVWREMQILAIVALMAALAIVYKNQARLLFEETLVLLRRTKAAKFGNIEVQVNDKVVNITERLEERAKHLRVLLDGLDGDHIGWLLVVAKAGRYEPTNAAKEKMRPLRNRGLLTHDGPTMAKTSHVWLTTLGEELVKVLQLTTPELQQTEPNRPDDHRVVDKNLPAISP
jgi:hypothetical protein